METWKPVPPLGGRGQVFIAIEDCLKAPKMHLDAGAEFGSGVNSLSRTVSIISIKGEPV